MDRRELLVTTGGVCSTMALAGCLDGDQTSDQDTGNDDGSRSSSPTSTSSSSSGNKDCSTELKAKSENIIDRSREIDGGHEWTHRYRCEADDTVHFDISTSAGQDIAVEIDSPQGETVYNEDGISLTTTHQFNNGGEGEVRIANLGERTDEEREDLWDDRVEIGAGNQLDPWAEIREGNRVDYYIRMVDGARPKLRIEDSSGNVHREHSVSSVIDDDFTAPKDDRYYFIVENEAWLTTGVWDYTFERVNEIPIPTTVDLTIEREYEEEIEVCN